MQRPSSIARPSGLSGVPDSGDNNSCNSSVITRPSLLTDIRLDLSQRMLTPWKVNDASLRPVPPFYPPLCPTCTVIITDSPPSVVASRISECLTKRSISVEYDEETVSDAKVSGPVLATSAHSWEPKTHVVALFFVVHPQQTAACVTVDRVHFGINLFRGRRTTLPPTANPETLDSPPDLSHAVIVEVMRHRGSNLSFHHHCRAILNAAVGHATGVDTRTPITTSCLEFPRLERRVDYDSQNKIIQTTKRTMTAADRTVVLSQALEHALSLLKKDRLGAQRLGMESLVHLTDIYSSGKDIAMQASLILIMGVPPPPSIMFDDDDDGWSTRIAATTTIKDLNTYLVRLLQDRVLPGDSAGSIMNLSVDSSVAAAESVSKSSEVTDAAHTRAAAIMVDDAYHGGLMRSMALRVLANALTVLSESQSSLSLPLTSILENSQFSTRKFIQSLAEDLLGATRLPAVVAGTRLASAHEATLATRCLGLLAQYCPTVRQLVVATTASGSPTWQVLQQNLHNVRHDALVRETRVTMGILAGSK